MGKHMARGQILFGKVQAFKIVFLAAIGAFIFSAGGQAAEPMQSAKNAYQFSFKTLGGEDMPLSQYNGKVLLIVNTASQCGFTKQYKDLQALYEKYQSRGLVVIGVPCNQFGGQEPGTPEEITEFTKQSYGVTFPMAAKVDVKGENAHPFYVWAGEQVSGGIFGAGPKWNFYKYLIGPEGEFIEGYGSQTSPMSDDIVSAIEGALPQ